jgi:hypothetical protein
MSDPEYNKSLIRAHYEATTNSFDPALPFSIAALVEPFCRQFAQCQLQMV